MNRCEVVPRHAELSFGFLVVAEELIDRLRLDDLPVRKILWDRALQQAQLPAGLEARTDRAACLFRERREDGVFPFGEVLKLAVRELLQMPHPCQVRPGQVRITDRRLDDYELLRQLSAVGSRRGQLVPIRRGQGGRRWSG